jgi:DNA repair exonuclease SbcCD ATPase subunit
MERIEEYEKRIQSLEDKLLKEQDRRHKAEKRAKEISKIYNDLVVTEKIQRLELEEIKQTRQEENRKNEREEARKRKEDEDNKRLEELRKRQEENRKKQLEEARKRQEEKEKKINEKLAEKTRIEQIENQRLNDFINEYIIKDPTCRINISELNEAFKYWYLRTHQTNYPVGQFKALKEHMRKTFHVENTYMLCARIKYDDYPVEIIDDDLDLGI